MCDHCLMLLHAQLEAIVSNTSALVQLRELVAEKRESSRKQSKTDSFFSASAVASDS